MVFLSSEWDFGSLLELLHSLLKDHTLLTQPTIILSIIMIIMLHVTVQQNNAPSQTVSLVYIIHLLSVLM
jgi:hypothetical protein